MIVMYQYDRGSYLTQFWRYIPADYFDDDENYWLIPGTFSAE